ncbi:MAG: methyltransferase domain-containing protein [Pseudomonadota bacterium]|nr:methyltransferase domain-containing protein [Pseudomonadota bacterium]
MATSKKSLKDAYAVRTPQDSIDLYREWASSYDDNFAKKHDYQSPSAIANYFQEYGKKEDTPVLDIGAGTGLVGECLKESFRGTIDGIDISPEMLEFARKKKCYSKLIQCDLTKNLPLDESSYGAVVSAGTFTHGHVGPDALDELLRVTKQNGLFVFTVHSEVFSQANFSAKLASLKTQITKPVYHEVRAYGNSIDKNHCDDTVFITIFRKK